MADLSAMYMDLAENARNAPYQGMLRTQQLMENQLAYQKAREDLEAQRGLRALFAQNPNATPEDVSRFSPQLGMEMTKAQQEAQERYGRMTKTQREISEMEAKAVAETIGPIAERAKMTGDIDTYNMEMGQALSSLAQQGIPLPMNFDPKVHTPDRVLMNSVGRGYRSPLIENQMAIQKEEMLSGVPQRPSYADIAGKSEYGPYGPRQIPPVPPPARMRQGTGMGGAPAAQLPEGYERATAEDIPAIQQAYDNATDLNEKQQIGALLNQLKQQTQPAGSQFVTPEQEIALRGQEEQQKADIQTKALEEREKTKTEVERSQAKQKAIEAFGLVPSLKEVEDLIAGSTSGKRQLQAATMFQDVTGKSTPGMENIGTLSVIAGRLRDAVNRAPGSQSDKDAIIESLKTGDIANPEIGANQRVKAYKEFVRQMREMIKKETGIDAGPIDGAAANQTPVTVKSRADVEALPKGTLFMGSDGVVHRRK